MLEAVAAVTVSLAIALPHALRLDSVAPLTASTIWLLALALRALVAVGAAIFAFVFLPRTAAFRGAAEWCWATISHHLGLSGHPLAHAVAVLPALALSASLLWVVFSLVRAALLLHLHLARRSMGRGPMGSVVVDEDEVLVALTGFGRARIVVSQRALGVMDDAELAASFAHEMGHLRRRHRPVLALGSALAALGRLLPGTLTAADRLALSLERDADDYAVRHTRDPLALASAICKAAGPAPLRSGLASLGGRGRVSVRLEQLVRPGRGVDARLERGARALAATMAALTLGLAISVPAWAMTAPSQAAAADRLAPACPH